MRNLIAFLILIVMASPSLGQPQTPLPPQAPPMVDYATSKPIPQAPPVERSNYEIGRDRSIATGKPLIVFVGTKDFRAIDGILPNGAVSCWKGKLDGYPKECVFVGAPSGNDVLHKATLPGTATDAQIRRAAGSEVRQSPDPFSPEAERIGPPRNLPSAKPERPGVDDRGRGPWPADLEFPVGAVRYEKARFTQSIYKNQFGSQIDPVPIGFIASKWHQPGGMEGISGWRSDLYKLIGGGRLWTGGIPVKNSFGNFQTELGHKREYDDGTLFIDSLSYEGKPFEIRQRKKVSGAWQSDVIFRDKEARPPGYAGLKMACSSCHDEAGTGGYGVGLVPGGDTVLSDPFESLEARGPSFVEPTHIEVDVPPLTFQPSMQQGRGRRR